VIVEGVLTTRDSDRRTNVAAMGVLLEESSVGSHGSWCTFRLRPFEGSRTFANLRENTCGVFHLVDDVELLARAALGDPGSVTTEPAETIEGQILTGCVRAFEFVVESADWSQPRANLLCRITRTHRRRDWIGWNRAQHAVLELTISATRVAMIERKVIEDQIRQLTPLVEKTAGARESAAWRFVLGFLETAWQKVPSRTGGKP
jgi:hypothetical protein